MLEVVYKSVEDREHDFTLAADIGKMLVDKNQLLSSQIDELSDLLSDEKELRDQLQTKLNDSLLRYSTLEQEAQLTNEICDKLTAANERLKKKFRDWASEQTGHSKEKSKYLLEEIELYRSQIEEQKSKYMMVRKQNKALKSTLVKYQDGYKKSKKLERKNENLEQRIKTTRALTEKIKSQLEEERAKQSCTMEEVANLQEAVDSLLKLNHSLKEKCEKDKVSLATAQTTIHQLREKLDQQQIEMNNNSLEEDLGPSLFDELISPTHLPHSPHDTHNLQNLDEQTIRKQIEDELRLTLTKELQTKLRLEFENEYRDIFKIRDQLLHSKPNSDFMANSNTTHFNPLTSSNPERGAGRHRRQGRAQSLCERRETDLESMTSPRQIFNKIARIENYIDQVKYRQTNRGMRKLSSPVRIRKSDSWGPMDGKLMLEHAANTPTQKQKRNERKQHKYGSLPTHFSMKEIKQQLEYLMNEEAHTLNATERKELESTLDTLNVVMVSPRKKKATDLWGSAPQTVKTKNKPSATNTAPVKIIIGSEESRKNELKSENKEKNKEKRLWKRSKSSREKESKKEKVRRETRSSSFKRPNTRTRSASEAEVYCN